MSASLDVRIDNRIVDGPHGPLPVRVYVPDAPIGSGLVWLHGGGFAFGDLDQPEADWVSRRLAGGGVRVVSVAYQLAPQRDFSRSDSPVSGGVHFPVASEEVSAAFEWARASFTELGLPPEAWSLGGASAGANLAASAALRARDKGRPQPRSLLLAYPALHAELPPASPELRAQLAALPEESFPPEAVRRMNLNYVGDPDLLASPYAFPGGQDLRGLPPTFILNSDVDGLRPSGESFASEIAAAGVDLLLIRENGTRHGHLNEPGTPGAARSIERLIAWLIPNPLVGVAHETSPHSGAAAS